MKKENLLYVARVRHPRDDIRHDGVTFTPWGVWEGNYTDRPKLICLHPTHAEAIRFADHYARSMK